MTKFAVLLNFLKATQDADLNLKFREIEKILGFPLPASARQYAPYWSTANHLGKLLLEVGWHATLRQGAGVVHFCRSHAKPSPGRPPKAKPERNLANSGQTPDLVLIGCVKEKMPGRHRVEDLFISPLFRGRAACARASGKPWFVLSAKHGLLAPDDVIDYYDVSLKEQPVAARQQWSRAVLTRIEERFGSVSGKVVEIHAGSAYRDFGLTQGLRERGAVVNVPLEHLRQGEQLAWYSRFQRPAKVPAQKVTMAPTVHLPPIARPEVERIVARMTREFMENGLDLSGRPGAPQCGWDGIPEIKLARRLKAEGISDVALRIVLTLGVTMDRARDADRLWDSVARLYEESPWAFDPALIRAASPERLRKALVETGVSQRHTKDVEAWYRVGAAMVNPDSPEAFRKVIYEGKGEYDALIAAMRAKMPDGLPWFPLLSGPKIVLVWLRMLAEPGGADISGLDRIPVAVDVQIRKVTEYLGVSGTYGRDLNAVRGEIQQVWHGAVSKARGPAHIEGTGAALDPVIWFFGKWGCTYCERAGRKRPISALCQGCLFDEIREAP